jgi:hypothetical protein
MPVQINEVTSNVQVTDSHALLNPAVLEKVIREAVKRFRAELDKDKQVDQENKLRPGASSRETSNWD